MSKTATQIAKASRRIARNILGPRLSALVRRPFREKLGSVGEYRSALSSKRGLEMGGPSAMLAHDGDLPVYDVLESLDNCLYSDSTIWTGDVREGNTFRFDPQKRPGAQIIGDATNLLSVKESSYDCVLACHCLEHIANPLLALQEWKRVLRNNGLLLLILPHKDGTFDWRRPVTPLTHLIEDYEKCTGEDDLTHLSEILELHDLSKDLPAGTSQAFRQRCLENAAHRAMHHHVFDTMAAAAIVDQAGFEILRVDNLRPCHIIILARRIVQRTDNSRFMEGVAQSLRRSPFPSDQSRAQNQIP